MAARRSAGRPRSRPPCGQAWSSASCTISPSALTRTAPTPGRCRMCSRSASPRAHRPTSSTSSVRIGRSRRGVPTNSSAQGYEPFRAHGQRDPAARERRSRRPHHRAVPVVVDPQGRATDRGHLRALRPRGDDRHPRARGPPRRGGGRRRGPRHGRTVGARLPGPQGVARHVDPVVRARSRRRRRTAGRRSAGASTACPRSPPTTCRRPRAIWPASMSGCAPSSGC